MTLTKPQETFLKDLLRDPTWVEILQAMKVSRPVKPWKPGGESSEKKETWVYESGIQRGTIDAVATLGLGKI